MSESLPPHFHMATEGLLSGSPGMIAILGYNLLGLEIQVTVEDRGGGGVSRDRRKPGNQAVVFHIRFKGETVLRRYEHDASPRQIKIAVKMIEKLNDLKLLVRSMFNRKSQTPINITITGITQKGDGKP